MYVHPLCLFVGTRLKNEGSIEGCMSSSLDYIVHHFLVLMGLDSESLFPDSLKSSQSRRILCQARTAESVAKQHCRKSGHTVYITSVPRDVATERFEAFSFVGIELGATRNGDACYRGHNKLRIVLVYPVRRLMHSVTSLEEHP